jgi:hypothetical protein
MGLARNLKKIWNAMVEGYSAGQSSPSTEPKGKPTSKKPDNSSETMSSPSPLTVESQPGTIATSSTDTSEKITMETQIESEAVSQVREWAMNKIELLHESDRHKNARALAAEFEEWINIPEDTETLEYLCLEDEGWTDQEIDVI